jgi:hypothetical protein
VKTGGSLRLLKQPEPTILQTLFKEPEVADFHSEIFKELGTGGSFKIQRTGQPWSELGTHLFAPPLLFLLLSFGFFVFSVFVLFVGFLFGGASFVS